MKPPVETEVKIRIGDAQEMRAKLENLGLRVSVERAFEANSLYDRPDKSLQKEGMLLRLRQIGDKNVVTWKGKDQPGRHKNRPESETTVGSVDVLGGILEHVGFARSFRYEKYRTEFTEGGDDSSAGTVTLDETPIGNFLELEGPEDWIDATAGRLGFSENDYLLDSYGRLYLKDCERRGVQPSNMTFAS